MRLTTFLGAALGAVSLCEGAAVPDADSVQAMAARDDRIYCRRDNQCLNSLFNDKPKAEYICKKLLRRPTVVYTTIYYPQKETKTFYNTKYSIIEVPVRKEVVKWLNPIVNKRQDEIPEGALTTDSQPAATTPAQPQATTDAELAAPTGLQPQVTTDELPLPTDSVSAQAIGDPEPANIPDFPVFAGQDPSFRYCNTIDDLKKACECFLDYIHIPKIVVKKVYKKKIIIVKKFQTIVKYTRVEKIIPSPLKIKNAVSCFRTYKPLQPISGIDTRPIIVNGVRTAWDCCQLCAKTDNCIAASYGPATYFDLYLNGSPFGAQPATSTTCTYLVQTQKLLGAATTDNCPLGSRNVEFGPVNGYGGVFAGPCGY